METQEQRMIGQAIIQRLDILIQQQEELKKILLEEIDEFDEEDEKSIEDHEEEKMIKSHKTNVRQKDD